jgi:hypothetical protein
VVPATNLRLSSFCNKISEPERDAIRRRRVSHPHRRHYALDDLHDCTIKDGFAI